MNSQEQRDYKETVRRRLDYIRIIGKQYSDIEKVTGVSSKRIRVFASAGTMGIPDVKKIEECLNKWEVENPCAQEDMSFDSMLGLLIERLIFLIRLLKSDLPSEVKSKEFVGFVRAYADSGPDLILNGRSGDDGHD